MFTLFTFSCLVASGVLMLVVTLFDHQKPLDYTPIHRHENTYDMHYFDVHSRTHFIAQIKERSHHIYGKRRHLQSEKVAA